MTSPNELLAELAESLRDAMLEPDADPAYLDDCDARIDAILDAHPELTDPRRR